MEFDVRFATLRSFVSVTETGSYAETARNLGLDATTVSKRIASLEEAVGAQIALAAQPPSAKSPSAALPSKKKVPKVKPVKASLFNSVENKELTDTGKELLAFALRTLGDFDALTMRVADVVARSKLG